MDGFGNKWVQKHDAIYTSSLTIALQVQVSKLCKERSTFMSAPHGKVVAKVASIWQVRYSSDTACVKWTEKCLSETKYSVANAC
jgi:hypothetical protein